jgi:acyl carrier protein
MQQISNNRESEHPMGIEDRVREMLLPVFNLPSIEGIKPEASLVNDLGAESLDFVQIIYLVEREFGVVLKPDEIMSGAASDSSESMFRDGKLTEEAAALLNKQFPGHAEPFAEGMTKRTIYLSITVRDLGTAIEARIQRGDPRA